MDRLFSGIHDWFFRNYSIIFYIIRFIVLLLFFHELNAQKPQPGGGELYAIDEGLSDRKVTQIIQDKFGFLWVGTSNGLNRFDGYEFDIFNNYPGNPLQISDNVVEKLFLDKDGNLVIVYQNNFLLFDILNPETYEVKKVHLLPSFGFKGVVSEITCSPKGNILIFSTDPNGLYLSTLLNGRLVQVFHTPEERTQQTTSLKSAVLKDGSYLINDAEKGLRIIGKDGKIIRQFGEEDFESLNSLDNYPAKANFLHIDKTGNCWFSLGNEPGLFYFEPYQGSLQKDPDFSLRRIFRQLWTDQVGNILLLSDNGRTRASDYQLLCVNQEGEAGGVMALQGKKSDVVAAFSPNFFRTIFLGMQEGLLIHHYGKSSIRYFMSEEEKEGISEKNQISALAVSARQDIVFSNRSGDFFQLDLESYALDSVVLNNSSSGLALNSHCWEDLEFDAFDGLWGIPCNQTHVGELHRIHLDSAQTKVYYFERTFLDIFPSRSDSLWLISKSEREEGVLFSFDPCRETFTKWRNESGINPLRNAQPISLLVSADGIVWVGTNKGLFRIDPKTKDYSQIQMSILGAMGLKSNVVNIIAEGKDSVLWIGTTNGLHRLDRSSGEIIRYHKQDGLASNNIIDLVKDAHNNLWICTSNGLTFMDGANESFFSFFEEDGLSSDVFFPRSNRMTSQGQICLGSANGVNVFRFTDLISEETPPRALLTRISKYNTRQDSVLNQFTRIQNLSRITLSPYDSYVQFHFALPKYDRPKHNRFWVKMDGLEEDWTDCGTRPFFRYNKLPHGSYTLQVKSADANGRQSPEYLSLGLFVRPKYYQTWWFYSLCLLFAGMFVYIIFQYQLKQRLKVERFRTRLSSDLHDEVSGLLAGIAMQTELLSEDVKADTNKAKLQAIAGASRKAISKMSDVIWSIDSRRDTVEDLMARMQDHAKEFLPALGVQPVFIFGKINKQQKMKPSIRQELFFIFKEALNNVAKHSKATEVTIKFGNWGNDFILSITDNGSGSLENNGSNGQGLANIRMRANRIDAQIAILNRNGFSVQLKMKKFA